MSRPAGVSLTKDSMYPALGLGLVVTIGLCVSCTLLLAVLTVTLGDIPKPLHTVILIWPTSVACLFYFGHTIAGLVLLSAPTLFVVMLILRLWIQFEIEGCLWRVRTVASFRRAKLMALYASMEYGMNECYANPFENIGPEKKEDDGSSIV